MRLLLQVEVSRASWRTIPPRRLRTTATSTSTTTRPALDDLRDRVAEPAPSPLLRRVLGRMRASLAHRRA